MASLVVRVSSRAVLARLSSPKVISSSAILPRSSTSQHSRAISEITTERMRRSSTNPTGRMSFKVCASSDKDDPASSSSPSEGANASTDASKATTSSSLANFANLTDGDFGTRGELWVAGQFLLFAGIAYPPDFLTPSFLPPSFCLATDVLYTNVAFGLVLLASGAWFTKSAVQNLGANLSPFPRPPSTGGLTTDGLYSIVRHPIYTGAILLALGFSFVTANTARLIVSLVLAVFFDLKAGQEEEWLVQKFGRRYEEYRSKVKKLLPFVY